MSGFVSRRLHRLVDHCLMKMSLAMSKCITLGPMMSRLDKVSSVRRYSTRASSRLIASAILLSLWLCCWVNKITAEDSRVDFATQILPVLSTHCFACHGPDAEHREADLRLDIEADAKESVVVPGNWLHSPLVERITSDDADLRMPPLETGKNLTDAEISLLKQWISEGADWGDHWAFVSPRRPIVPTGLDSSWPQCDIDRFVLSSLQKKGLAPSEPAARSAWLRRVSFDLIGLPPTPEEVAEFVANQSSDAFEKEVDRLLKSPHYGERMAIEWLDLARFADTNGYQNDFHRSMWPWRDWVIRAFNNNMPADQFLIEQLAGDLLTNPTSDQLIATGFNRNHRMVTEGGSIDEEWRIENVVDRVETTASAFMGLTMGCARCHDHKYDPISRRDFYQFFAFFNNVDEQGVYNETRGNVPPLISVPTLAEQEELAELDRRIAQLEQQASSVAIDIPRYFGITESSGDESSQAGPRTELHLLAGGEILQGHLECEATNMLASDSVRYVGNNATWSSGPTTEGLVFLGEPDSHVDVGQGFVVEADQKFGWTLWSRVEAPGALISKMDDDHGYRGYDTIVLDDFRLKVHLIDSWPSNALAVTTKMPIPRNAWFHLAVTYDGSRTANGIQLWIDGQPVALNIEQNSLTGSLKTDQSLRIGRRSQSLFLKGSIADLRFCTEILNTETVNKLRMQDLRQLVPDLQVDAADLPPTLRDYIRSQQSHSSQQQIEQLRTKRTTAAKSVQTTMVMRDRTERRPTYALRRGQYDQPETSEELLPQIPASLGELSNDLPRNRLGLAQWLVQPTNPLVARVMVNRIWQRMFGQGLVSTPDNFGVQGDPPSHLQLLDWLAIHFVESGWDVKQLHREIALSATYRQSAVVSPEVQARDPENRWLSRGPRYRLPAELVRDNALSVSGLLSHKIGGPSVMPYQPDGLWDELAGGASGGPYQVAEGADLYRRSLYTFRKRTVSHPTLATFDAPSWEICQAKRGTTNTPLQALALLNDVTYIEAAIHLGVRMQTEVSQSNRASIQHGFLLATLREPNENELATLEAGYSKYFDFYQQQPEAARQFLSHGKAQVSDEMKTPKLAALAAVAAVLLNLDETITK